MSRKEKSKSFSRTGKAAFRATNANKMKAKAYVYGGKRAYPKGGIYGNYGGGGRSTSGKYEIKSVDLAETAYSLNLATGTNAQVFLLNGVQEGNSESQRNGRKIWMKSLYMNGFLEYTGTGVAETDYARIMIVYDRAPNAAAALPLYSDMFKHTTQAQVTATDPLSNLNIDYKDRFTIIRDWRMMLPATTAGGVTSTTVTLTGCEGTINKYIPLDLEVQYNSTSSPCTVSNINTGALYLVTQGSYAVGGWEVELGFRLRYEDI